MAAATCAHCGERIEATEGVEQEGLAFCSEECADEYEAEEEGDEEGLEE